MSVTYYTLDVFTDTLFQGAQIAVFPDAEGLPEEQLGRIARELNLSETAFIYKVEEEENTFKVRIFSPTGEKDFAGHPILAIANVLAETGKISLLSNYTSLTVKQNSQDVTVNISVGDNGKRFVQFTLSSTPVVDRFTPTSHELAKLLSIDEIDIDHTNYHTRLVSSGLPYLIVPLKSQTAVHKARFDVKAWAESSAPAMAAQEIFVFSTKTDSDDCNFHGRLLGPSISDREDPPLGSVMPTFAGYLASHDHIRVGTYSFAIDRGTLQTRRSLLHIEMDKRVGRPVTLRVGGDSVLVSKSELLIG